MKRSIYKKNYDYYKDKNMQRSALSVWIYWSNQLCYDGWVLWKKKRRLIISKQVCLIWNHCYKSLILNSQIEIKVVTQTFPQGTFELTSTIQFHYPNF